MVISLDIFAQIAKYKQENKSILAVGTTMIRLLETLPYAWKDISTHKLNYFDDNTIGRRDKLCSDIAMQEHEVIASLSFEEDKVTINTKLYIYP